MAAIILTHPVHGAKVASSPEEAETDAKRGWKEVHEKDLMPAKVVEKVDTAAKKVPPSNASGEGTRPVNAATSPAGQGLSRQGAPDAAIAKADIDHAIDHQGEAGPTLQGRADGTTEDAVQTTRRRRAPVAPVGGEQTDEGDEDGQED